MFFKNNNTIIYMDSDWVFNFDCNQPITKTSKYFDDNIIPTVFYQSVINRSKEQIYTVIKNNPKLAKDIIAFYQYSLASSFNFKKNAKFGANTKVRWALNNNLEIIMNFNDQVDYYKYIVVRKWNMTNFGFLFQTIRQYLSDLSYGLYLIKNKHCGSKYYYKLGINVTNDQEFRVFIRNFV
jgi:hypothetical protein